MASTKPTLVVVIGLLCLACSREHDELYRDPHADPNVKVGQRASEQVEPADEHDGRYSVHEYEFIGKGAPHKMSEVRKYGLDHMGSRGSDVSAKVHVEWPEEKSGLSKDALAKVRKTILWMAFALVPVPTPYSGPESLGETEESLIKRDKELWAMNGENREIDEYGLQPADWMYLVSDALSIEAGRREAKDDGRITDTTLELAMSGIKTEAMNRYKCSPPEKLNESWWHICSQWTFTSEQHLDWPFGVTAMEDAEWYERPVLCVWIEGYDNDGGHGIHSSYCSKVYSIPDGMELGIEDYFAHDKLKALMNAIWKRYLYKDWGDEKSSGNATKGKQAECLLEPTELDMQITKTGIKWTWAKDLEYEETSVFMKWEELEAFRKE